MRYSKKIFILMILMMISLATFGISQAFACTSIQLESLEGDPYWFRTCDMDDSYNVFGEGGSYIAPSYLVSYPKGVPAKLTLETIVPKHTVFGMSFSDSTAMLDGMNDAGLICGLQNFVESTDCPIEKIPKNKRIIAGMEAVTWFLMQCSDISDVKQLAKKSRVTAALVDGVVGSDVMVSMHLVFVDKDNESIILEAADPKHPGKFTIHKSNGVMSNSPDYQQHLQILDNYVNHSTELHDKGFTEISLNGIKFGGKPQKGHIAFPGSYASRDRFVRMSIMRFLVDGGTQIPNSQMLVRGNNIISTTAATKENGKNVMYYNYLDENGQIQGGGKDTYTQYTVAYDSTRRRMAIRPYDTGLWTTLSLEQIPTDGRATFPIHRGPEGITIQAKMTEQTVKDLK